MTAIAGCRAAMHARRSPLRIRAGPVNVCPILGAIGIVDRHGYDGLVLADLARGAPC